jgi:hypothetical protein
VAHLVDSPEAAARLADHVLDPARERPVLCVTMPAWATEPLLDVEALEGAVDGAVEIWQMPTGDASWELSYRLPTGLDVYGGAVRLWWPGLDERADRYEHPLFLVHDRSDSPAVVGRVLAALERGGLLGQERPRSGSEHGAVVTRVLPTGAELELADGTPAFAHRTHLSRHELLPERVVRVGQPLRVRVGETPAGRRRLAVSLLPFEPEPWDRLVADHPVGSVLEGVVTGLRNFGAMVSLLPGVTGLVHKSRISDEWVGYPGDVLSEGERVSVRIERIDEGEQKVDLSMRDVPTGAQPVIATLYPDGPPWLGPPAPVVLMRPLPPSLLRPAPVPEAPLPEPSPETPAPAGSEPSEHQLASELEQVVAQGRDMRRALSALFDDSRRRLARLQGEAAQIRQGLERDLADVRRRILEAAETETGQIIGSTQQALDAARAEAQELRAQLTVVEQDRDRLLERLRDTASRAERADREARDAQAILSGEREAADQLRAELRRVAPDEPTRLRDDIHSAWLRATTPADRDQYGWREPALGEDLLPSLTHVHGVSRERVVEVCAEVVCGRARERTGLEVHPLRTSEGGGTPQLVREDGAKAYRASLQVNTPSARRLHYWELPDGGVELAKIAYHDDFSIR